MDKKSRLQPIVVTSTQEETITVYRKTKSKTLLRKTLNPHLYRKGIVGIGDRDIEAEFN